MSTMILVQKDGKWHRAGQTEKTLKELGRDERFIKFRSDHQARGNRVRGDGAVAGLGGCADDQDDRP